MARTKKKNEEAPTPPAAEPQVHQISGQQAPSTEADANVQVVTAEEVHEKQIQETIDKQVAALDVNKVVIQGWREKFAALQFTSLQDKEAIKAIREGRSFMRTKRNEVDKRRLELGADARRIQKGINDKANEYLDEMMEIEEDLIEKVIQIDAAENEERTRKEREEKERIDARIDALKAAGMTFDGSFYVIGPSISADVNSIKGMSDETFATFEAKVKFEKVRLDEEQEKRERELREAEEERKRQREEDDRIRRENEAENERLKQEAEDLRKQREKDEEERQALLRERAALRQQKVEGLGLTFDSANSRFVYSTVDGLVAIAAEDLKNWSTPAFDEWFADVQPKAAGLKAAQDERDSAAREKQIKERRTASRIGDLYSRFFVYQEEGAYYAPVLDDELFADIAVLPADVEGLSDDDWANLIHAVDFKINEVRTKKEEEARQVEEERMNTLQERIELMKSLGMEYTPTAMIWPGSFVPDGGSGVAHTAAKYSSPEAWEMIEQVLRKESEWVANAKAEDAEEKRKAAEALKSDSQKVCEYLDRLKAVEVPDASLFESDFVKREFAGFLGSVRQDVDILRQSLNC